MPDNNGSPIRYQIVHPLLATSLFLSILLASQSALANTPASTDNAPMPHVQRLQASPGQPATLDAPHFRVVLQAGEAWVRTGQDKSTLWLLRGNAHIEHPTSGRIELDQPMTFVEARGTTAASPVLPVSAARAAAWSGNDASGATPASHTAEPTTSTLAPMDGGWAVQIASLAQRTEADALRLRLEQQGIRSEVHEARVDGRTHYRVRVGGFNSRDAAQAFVTQHPTLFAQTQPWITCVTGDC